MNLFVTLLLHSVMYSHSSVLSDSLNIADLGSRLSMVVIISGVETVTPTKNYNHLKLQSLLI